MQLVGKTALVTGGRRLGGQLARLLADRGCNVALSYLTSAQAAEDTARDCRQRGVAAETFVADLRDPAQAEKLVQDTATRFGTVDVLINLTSVFDRTPLAGLSYQQYEDIVAANLNAPVWTAVAAARQMQRQPVVDGLQGKIIHFTDWAVDRPYRGYLPYLVAKGGLVTFTKTLAVELAPTITVNAIAPGPVCPPPELSQAALEDLRTRSVLGRIGMADDVNRAVLYLVEGTDYVTGEIYRVDGGQFLGAPDER